ncbi:MAG TPA: hypothetical protein VLZ89_15035 [Anaerolineales bacterium]|nr:hypothetical protein [Anaerolineales bacterium]
MLNFVSAILGGALLLAGRKLFWLFVGAIGFVVGVQVATRFLHGSDLMVLLAGLGLGVVFAGLAVFVESLAIGLAGFLGGGYILLSLGGAFGLDQGILSWILFAVGGLIGAALIAALFDWALICISSLAGSAMILSAFRFGRLTGGLIFIILLFVGIALQASVLAAERRGARRRA